MSLGLRATAPVSVVIPVHGGAAQLRATLEAVVAQQRPPAEVVVVDDGSPDESSAIAQSILPELKLLRHEIPRGVSSARNAGLAAASQPFVCFLDQDDIWHPTHLARQLEAFERLPQAGAVVVPYHHWYPDGEVYPAPESIWPARADDDFDPAFTGWVYHQFMLDCWALTSATMIRREALEQVGGFDAERPYGEDWELWLRLSRRWQFARLGAPAVLYRQHPTQGSRKARAIDYRTELLLGFAAEHGLASADGRAISRSLFESTIAGYEAQFGLHHLRHGDSSIGRAALWQAWRRRPVRLRHLAMAFAASAGWRAGRDSAARTHLPAA